MMPSLRQIQYFLAAASTGQISRAAVTLNVTQSSITIAIKGLEDALGYRLLVRHAKGVRLTSRGEIFQQHARKVLAAAEDLMQLPSFVEDDFEGEVKVGLTYTVSGYFLPRLVAIITRELPRLRLTYLEISRAEIEAGVRSGTLDLGIVLISDITDATGLDLFPLLVSRRRLWVGADHRLAKRETVSLSELANEPYVVIQADGHEQTMRKSWDRHGFTPNIVFRTQSMEAVRSLVAAGHGVSIMSDMVHRSWSLEAQRILRKELVESVDPLITGLIWAKDRSLTPATAKLIELGRSSQILSQVGVVTNDRDAR